MTNETFSIVGVYYSEGSTINALIYRIFDGTIYPFLTHEINFDRLATHQLVDAMYIYEFNQESWSLDGNRELLSSRLRTAINRCIIQNTLTPDYKKLIMNAAGIINTTIVNGYYRINEILLAITNDDPSRRKSSLHRNIVDCKYLNTGQNIVKGYRREYNDPSPETIIMDSQRRLNDLAQSVIVLLCENPAYRNYLTRLGNNNNIIGITQTPSISTPSISSPVYNVPVLPVSPVILPELDELSSHTSEPMITMTVPADISEELTQLRGIITEITQSFVTGVNPVISIVDLISVYNELADKGNVSRIEINQPIKYKSVGALLISGADGLRSNEVRIELRSGEILYIPCTGEGIEQLSNDEKLEVLRYVLSLRKATNSYNGLLDIIVRECASKSRQTHAL
jgi:hypothetical protein